jgi:phosphoribosylanthranilate isomerase
VKVKICGVTRVVDAVAAVEAGASAIGFIFVRSSKRYIDPARVKTIIGVLPPSLTTVGVFVDAPRDEILRTVEISGVRAIQLHGSEKRGDLEGYSIPVFKAFRVGPSFDLSVLSKFGGPVYLLDRESPSTRAQEGKTFNWKVAVRAKKYGRIILAGGLSPGNVREAITRVSPYALDVSSGLEIEPGVKDHRKINAFFSAIKAAGALEDKEKRCLF